MSKKEKMDVLKQFARTIISDMPDVEQILSACLTRGAAKEDKLVTIENGKNTAQILRSLVLKI